MRFEAHATVYPSPQRRAKNPFACHRNHFFRMRKVFIGRKDCFRKEFESAERLQNDFATGGPVDGAYIGTESAGDVGDSGMP